METENKNPIQVAERLFGALEFLSERESAGLMEVARHLDLNKSTTHRIDTGHYKLTSKLEDIARTSRSAES